MAKILIIDDEPRIRETLSDILKDEKHSIATAADGLEGLNICKEETIHLIFLDVWLPNMGGIDVLKEVKRNFPEIEVIIISGHGNIDLAVKAVKLGAFDFLEKPLSLDKIITITRNALAMEDLKKENRALKERIFIEDDLIAVSPAMIKIKEIIAQSAPSDARILILGENGTGKELIAREIHRKSIRARGPFIEVNCAAIPENLIESELFGHEKGSFTGAVARRKGKFEMAHRGTIFLDEIADMSLFTQAKVLRVIQELTFERIGGENSIHVDVRVIAATNKDLQKEIQEKRFREDLFFRLNVIPIQVPPLRERKEDLAELILYFQKKLDPASEPNPKTFSKEALDYLHQYAWPGNVRELKNFIER
ncbi:MAG: sigma-54-dependent Fis family transcriptional regulator, partial [Spirochaetales bacterium]